MDTLIIFGAAALIMFIGLFLMRKPVTTADSWQETDYGRNRITCDGCGWKVDSVTAFASPHGIERYCGDCLARGQ